MKSCLTNVINLCDEVTGLLDGGTAVGITYLGSHKILTEKLLMYGLDVQTVKWIENCLNGWAQNLVGGQ